MLHKFANWLDDRTGILTACKVVGNRRWVKWLMAVKVCPALLMFLAVIQVITGFVLWMHYCPGTQSAYESTFYIQNVLWCGWLLRGLHHYSAQFFVAIAMIYVLKQIFLGLYRVPREVVFWTSLLLFFFGLGACLTGDLLPWTQNGYGATMVRVKYLTQIPFIGQALYQIAVGGDTVNNYTLTHFMAFHIGLFAAGILVLTFFHAVCDARAERNSLNSALSCGKLQIPTQKEGSCGGCRSTGVARWWSCQAAVNGLACLIVMIIILGCITHGHFGAICTPDVAAGQNYGVALGVPADTSPTTVFGTARPEWTFRGLYQYALMFSGSIPEFVLIFCVTACVLGVFFLMPFIARIKKYHAGHLFNMAYTILFAVIMTSLTMASYKNDASNAEFQAAQAQEKADSARLFALVSERGGFPNTGALSVLQSDWLTQGPKLFKQHCASCHQYAPADEKAVGTFFRTKEPTAPNIYAMGTYDWMAGWLDPEIIKTPNYYGYKDSTLRNGGMAKWVKETFDGIAELEESDDEDDKAEAKEMRDMLKLVAQMLVAESKLTTPRTVVDGKIEGIDAKTIDAFDYLDCAQCHDFYTYKATSKSGPDLAMYASTSWVSRVISDPGKFFFAENAMSAYCVEGAENNPMTTEEVQMLAKWLTVEK